jgi:hypothetical protein
VGFQPNLEDQFWLFKRGAPPVISRPIFGLWSRRLASYLSGVAPIYGLEKALKKGVFRGQKMAKKSLFLPLDTPFLGRFQGQKGVPPLK